MLHRNPHPYPKSILALVPILLLSNSASWSQNSTPQQPLNQIATVGPTRIWQRPGELAFLYKSKMDIDADGAPNTYNPDSSKGIDDLSNGGQPGNWWAVVTDTGEPNGRPILQGPDDPAPGFYVSTTSLQDTTKEEKDPHRYVDAEKIPYFVLPPPVMKAGDAQLGDFAVVLNTHNNKMAYAIFADTGPAEKIGEGSIALAKALGIDADARRGGIHDGIVFLVFPHSGNGKPRSAKEIKREGSKQLKTWGGIDQLKTLAPGL